MAYLRVAVLLAVLINGYALPAAAQQASNPPQSATLPTITPPTLNPAVSTTLTCAEFLPLVHSKTSGYATIWLDGYYSARSGITELPAGWIRTLAQGLGGICSIDSNSTRPVLDIIAEVHHDYGTAK